MPPSRLGINMNEHEVWVRPDGAVGRAVPDLHPMIRWSDGLVTPLGTAGTMGAKRLRAFTGDIGLAAAGLEAARRLGPGLAAGRGERLPRCQVKAPSGWVDADLEGIRAAPVERGVEEWSVAIVDPPNVCVCFRCGASHKVSGPMEDGWRVADPDGLPVWEHRCGPVETPVCGVGV